MYLYTCTQSPSPENTPHVVGYCQSLELNLERYNTTARVLDEYFVLNSIFRHFAVPGLSQDWLQQDSKGFATGAAAGL